MIQPHRDSVVAGTSFRPTNIAHQGPDARSDISSRNRERPVLRASSPYARRSHRPCRIHPAAQLKVVASRVAGAQAELLARGAPVGQPATVSQSAPLARALDLSMPPWPAVR